MSQIKVEAPRSPDTLAESFHYCQTVTHQEAKNFYYGLRLMPEPKRSSMYAIYAWMRAADDLADEAGHETAKRAELDRFLQATQFALQNGGEPPPDPPQVHADMWPAVARTLVDYEVPMDYLQSMIDGQLLDQRKRQYADFDELYEYCYKVASTVGLVCITVWGYDGLELTRKMAEHRGVALQLTNILRDIVEDAERGRVYLPADELQRFGVDIQAVSRGEPGSAFDQFMAYQVNRAEEYYRASADLELHLDPACRPTSWAMMRIYHTLLGRISRDPRRVLTGRVRLRKRRKLLIAMHAMWKRSWG